MKKKVSVKKQPKGSTARSGPAPWVGQSVRRKEESRLVQGKGIFVDDVRQPGMLHMKLVRAPVPHAVIERVDVSRAAASPGVVCTLTGEEIAKLVTPFIEIGPDPGAKIQDYPMAVKKVRYQGEPVAAVVAETPQAAEDAAELVEVDYQSLPPVIDSADAASDKVLLHDEAGTNRLWQGVFEYGDVAKAFRTAAHVVHIDKMHFHRFSSTPLETSAVIAQWNPK